MSFEDHNVIVGVLILVVVANLWLYWSIQALDRKITFLMNTTADLEAYIKEKL